MRKKNILIYFGNQLNPQKGGTERVACALADYLIKNSHNVILLAARKIDDMNSRESYFLPQALELPTKTNLSYLSNLLEKEKIDIIINEGASTESVYLFSHEHIRKNVKIINHLHFSIKGDLKYFYRSLNLSLRGHTIRTKISNILRLLKSPYNKHVAYKNKYKRYSYMVKHSDAVVVLSEKQRINLMKFLRFNDADNIYAITNPYTILDFGRTNQPKFNNIIYVGRLDYPKRIDRIFNVWYQINKKLANWQLIIIGDGPDKNRLENIVFKKNLPRVIFRGYTNPDEYYKSSKILLLTSNFEGTPMVIPEAMSHGVVPIVMGTFEDADLLIKNGINGFITPPLKIKKMAKTIIKIANDEERWHNISNNSIMSVSNVNNDEILKNWEILLNES